MSRVCILDYGSGNVRSVSNLLSLICADVVISNKAIDIVNSTHIVLPGVGSFGASMSRMREHIPLDILEDDVLRKGKPFLGICVGMQVLATEGTEFGTNPGLGWIPGRVDKLKSGENPLPHVGWNDVRSIRDEQLLKDFAEPADFYFVHSYAFVPDDPVCSVALTDYGQSFTSIVRSDNICGVQFHPEKSLKAGRVLLEAFLNPK